MARPRIYDTADQLEIEVEKYFDSTPQTEITISGLALHLGFESRQSLYDYEKNSEFSYIIKRARLRVELAYEWRLNSNSCTGAIFALKNMGWKDKMEQDIKHSGGLTMIWQDAEYGSDYNKENEGLKQEPGSLSIEEVQGDSEPGVNPVW